MIVRVAIVRKKWGKPFRGDIFIFSAGYLQQRRVYLDSRRRSPSCKRRYNLHA